LPVLLYVLPLFSWLLFQNRLTYFPFTFGHFSEQCFNPTVFRFATLSVARDPSRNVTLSLSLYRPSSDLTFLSRSDAFPSSASSVQEGFFANILLRSPLVFPPPRFSLCHNKKPSPCSFKEILSFRFPLPPTPPPCVQAASSTAGLLCPSRLRNGVGSCLSSLWLHNSITAFIDTVSLPPFQDRKVIFSRDHRLNNFVGGPSTLVFLGPPPFRRRPSFLRLKYDFTVKSSCF